MLIVLIVIALVIILAFTGVGATKITPEKKGKAGEEEVSGSVQRNMSSDDQLIDDVIIPGKNGMTSQIDHVLVSTKGIFVIETKALSGRIYGSEEQDHWTQVLAYGKEKHRHYSPVKQNEVHITRLRQLIKDYDIPIHNIVIFTDADITHVNCSNVFNPRSFSRYLKKMSDDAISMNRVVEIANTIRYYKEHPIETTEQHVAKIQEANRNINNGRCPRCGGKLVLRHSKDGKTFFGCSNFPKCRYTKKC